MKRDFRIPRSAADTSDDASFLWGLIEPVWPDDQVKDELRHIARATPGQRALYVLTLFVREVDNGGIEQFFFNSTSIYSEAVREAFRLLGANDRAAAFDLALSIFPGGKVPLDQGERIQAMNAAPKRKGLFKLLGKQLGGEENLWPLFRAYVKAHPEEFFTD